MVDVLVFRAADYIDDAKLTVVRATAEADLGDCRMMILSYLLDLELLDRQQRFVAVSEVGVFGFVTGVVVVVVVAAAVDSSNLYSDSHDY